MNRITDGFRGASMFASSETAKYYNALADLEDKLERGEMVEVVRCRDCEHGKPLPEKHRHEFAEGVLDCYCRRADPDIHDICAVWPDGYCDEGEPKEDA